jgi:hypothetical protein
MPLIVDIPCFLFLLSVYHELHSERSAFTEIRREKSQIDFLSISFANLCKVSVYLCDKALLQPLTQ